MNKKMTIVLLDEIDGALARITTVVADASVNLVDINAEEIENMGVVQIEVEEADFATAHESLREAGFQVMPQEVLLVKIEDKPGGLAQLAVKLADARVNVRSMRIVKREDGYCLAAIVPEPVDIARAVLSEYLIASV